MALSATSLNRADIVLSGLLILALPGLVLASEHELTGADITLALTGKRVKSVDGTTSQSFYKSGETVYTANGSPSQGGWDVRGNFYCSVWPPNENWVCYKVVADGDVLTFVSDGGKRYPVTVTGDIPQ